MADDHRPHLHPDVVRLCWQRGYAFTPHGGGVTPVVQTVNTYRNQAVKARYQAREVAAMIRLMRDGVAVHYLRLAECVDLMVDVLSDMACTTLRRKEASKQDCALRWTILRKTT